MKLLLLFIGFQLYRGGQPAETAKPQPIPLGEAEEILTALPLKLVDQVLAGTEEFLAKPYIKKAPIRSVDKVLGDPRPSAVNVKSRRPDVQILPMPIAVGEPSPQKPVDFSLDGYFYEGTKKIAAYRIDFRGVHFKEDKKRDDQKTTASQVDVKTTEATREFEATTEAVRPVTEDNGGQKTTEAKPSQNDDSAPTESVPAITVEDFNYKTSTAEVVVETTEKAETKEEGPVPTTAAAASATDSDGSEGDTTKNSQTSVKDAVTPAAGASTTEKDPIEPIITESADKESTAAPAAPAASTEASIAPTHDAPFESSTADKETTAAPTVASTKDGAVESTAADIDSRTYDKETTVAQAASTGAADKETTAAPVSATGAADKESTAAAVSATGAVDKETTAEPASSTGAPAAPVTTADALVDPIATKTPGAPAASTKAPAVPAASTAAPASTDGARESREVRFTGVPPKPEILPGKCTVALTFSYDATAGRCLANSTFVCTEEDWAAVGKKTFGVCMKSAPKVTPADNNVKSDCGLGKIYAQVPGEPSADLYGRRCADAFCPKEATCVQEKTAAHCCILPRWAHYG